jgi:hypothetical protein
LCFIDSVIAMPLITPNPDCTILPPQKDPAAKQNP